MRLSIEQKNIVIGSGTDDGDDDEYGEEEKEEDKRLLTYGFPLHCYVHMGALLPPPVVSVCGQHFRIYARSSNSLQIFFFSLPFPWPTRGRINIDKANYSEAFYPLILALLLAFNANSKVLAAGRPYEP